MAPSDTEALRYAAALPLDDFEDAMQVAAARACGARVIASRNVSQHREMRFESGWGKAWEQLVEVAREV